jgi:hypothetical protein
LIVSDSRREINAVLNGSIERMNKK